MTLYKTNKKFEIKDLNINHISAFDTAQEVINFIKSQDEKPREFVVHSKGMNSIRGSEFIK